MNLFGSKRRRSRNQATEAAAESLAEIAKATRDLEQRVQRLEKDSEVFSLQRRRELRRRGIAC